MCASPKIVLIAVQRLVEEGLVRGIRQEPPQSASFSCLLSALLSKPLFECLKDNLAEGLQKGLRPDDCSKEEQSYENAANCVLARSPCRWEYSRAHSPLSACAWIREHHCSRIHALLRSHGCFVSAAVNGLHSFGLREDEVCQLRFFLSVWFYMATDNGLAVCAATIRSLFTHKSLH